MNNFLLAGSEISKMKWVQEAFEAGLQDYCLDWAESIPEMQEKLLRKKYDLLIFDLQMEAEHMAGCLFEVLSADAPPRVLTYYTTEEVSIATLLYHSGLKGFIRTDSEVTEWLMAVQTILEEKIYLSPGMQARLLDMDPDEIQAKGFSVLTNTELKILFLLLREERVVDISSRFGLSPGTISNIKKRVLKKLAITNVSDVREMLYGVIIPRIRPEI